MTYYGSDTHGGEGGKILHVSNLNPTGHGSLREAIETSGLRNVVFDVSGTIDLNLEKLRVRDPFITIEGGMGPSPGITLIRGGLSIRTHDVIVRHLKVRPGDGGEGTPLLSDGISFWGSEAHHGLIENCSVSWGTDENISVSGPDGDIAHDVTFRRCLISNGLQFSTHPKGQHSRGALIRGKNVSIEECLFAHNHRRNPVFRDGATGRVVNNTIYNPGTAAIHTNDAVVSVSGNILIPGKNTLPGLPIFSGNGMASLSNNLKLELHEASEQIKDRLRNVGAVVGRRDLIDRLTLRPLRRSYGKIIDSQDDVGGYPS